MARAQDTRKARNYGKSLLTPSERSSHIPWYAGERWSTMREARLRRAARKQAVSHERAVMRREAAARERAAQAV